MLDPKNCPTAVHFQTRCAEKTNEPGDVEGECQCNAGFIFNPQYTNDNDYCIIDTNQPDDTKQSNSKSGRSSNSSYSSQSENNNLVIDEPKIQSTPRPHHIVAGVLIPIVFVLIVIGSIFVYMKLHVTQRIRNIHRRTHRNRPFYEDVMLGTNDNDDPPLI